MNSSPSPHNRNSRKERTLTEGMQKSIHPIQHESNVTDGSEFLDDPLRMKDQLLEEIQQTKIQTTKKENYDTD